MIDLFHDDIPDGYLAATVKIIELANWHTLPMRPQLTLCQLVLSVERRAWSRVQRT